MRSVPVPMCLWTHIHFLVDHTTLHYIACIDSGKAAAHHIQDMQSFRR